MARVESSRDEIFLSDDLSGEHFLHIGCGTGDLCRKALQRGAASATGLDISRERIRSAIGTASEVQMSSQFIETDFEKWNAAPKSFDVVACGNLLHHMYGPVAAVRKIMLVTRKRFYIHVAPELHPPGHMASIFARIWGPRNRPSIFLGRRGFALRAADCTFAFQKDALEIIINRHSKAFEPVKFHPLRNGAGWIIEARRRQIGHLVVVAAATAAGKSRFIERLSQPPMRERFGLGDDRLRVIKAEEIDELGSGFHSTVVLHYDLLRPFDRPLQTHERDPAFHLLSSAERVTLITLANTADVLKARMMERRVRRQAAKLPLVDRATRKLEMTEGPRFYADWYESWFSATSAWASGDQAHFVLSDEQYSDLRDVRGVLHLFDSSPRRLHDETAENRFGTVQSALAAGSPN
jgi:ubiquinone/menaquinone biosynthesis C-methylase UbiE